MGYQYPRTGEAYAGVLSWSAQSDAREYITVELLEELRKDTLYSVGFYFSACDGLESLTTDFGLQFSENSIADTTAIKLPYNPEYTVSDTACIDSINIVDWILVQDIYQAKGGEKHITLGCFRDSLNIVQNMYYDPTAWWTQFKPIAYTTYHYIDDVFVIPLSSIPDTTNTDTTSSIQMLQKPRQLLRITDMLGRETQPKPNTPLFYLYDDGTVEKRIVVE